MFDKYIYPSGGSKYVSSSVTVHEHRAPTDESLRILDEMERKVLNRIVQSAVLTGEGIEIPYVTMEHEVTDFGYVIRAGMKCNGKWENISIKLRPAEWDRCKHFQEELVKTIVDKMAEKLASVMFNKLIGSGTLRG